MSELYLGSGVADAVRVTLDGDHLTTHAVCVGMTGSGKTGLGIVVLEELARRRTPLLVIDLKGDMVNLLLTFPDLAPADFSPWLPADAVRGADRTTVAAEQATTWSSGLARSGLSGEDVRAVRSGLDWQLLTPGVGALAPINILPALSRPDGWREGQDPDGTRERVNTVAGALLSLVGRGGDPLTDRDQVLVSSVILEAWRAGRDLDLAGLLAAIVEPPMETLGVLPLDVFYPRKERMQLVLDLNTLLASPAFAAWTEGVPMTMETLLGSPQQPRGTVIALAHLDERQRLFLLTLLVGEMVSWMRRQPAASGLRSLLYMDEVQGILPPHPANPPTKQPLLTLLKQGRAFGCGAWLATQNPVDLDYKALGNAGVKVVGRLVTERDRDRALEGFGMQQLADGRSADDVVAGLGKREFLLDDVRADPRVQLFSSRWAMSYLRGPVTLAELEPLIRPIATTARTSQPAAAPQAVAPPPPPPPAANHPPVLTSDIEQRFAAESSGPVRPWLVAEARVTLERKTLDLFRVDHEVWEVPIDGDGELVWDGVRRLDEAPTVVGAPPEGTEFPSAAPAELDEALRSIEEELVRWRANNPEPLLVNETLGLVAEPGESRERFIGRCLEAADQADDSDQDRIRTRYEKKIATLKRRIERERDELERDQAELASRKAETGLGVVEGLLSVFLGSRSTGSAARKAASRVRSVASKRRMTQRAAASVTESEREIERLAEQADDLLVELQEEIDQVAASSEQLALQVEELALRPKRFADVDVRAVYLLWR